MSDSIGERVQKAVGAALDKKAFDLDVLDVSKLTTIGDYFVICSTTNERQSVAVADAIEEALFAFDRTKVRVLEGINPGRWVLLDFGDFVIHIFTEECRHFYALERLWGDAPNVTRHFIGAPLGSASLNAPPSASQGAAQ